MMGSVVAVFPAHLSEMLRCIELLRFSLLLCNFQLNHMKHERGMNEGRGGGGGLPLEINTPKFPFFHLYVMQSPCLMMWARFYVWLV